MGRYSTFLMAEPSFVEGVARILDFGNTLTEYNRAPSDEQADAAALEADWKAVAEDLARAFAKVGAETGVAKRLKQES